MPGARLSRAIAAGIAGCLLWLGLALGAHAGPVRLTQAQVRTEIDGVVRVSDAALPYVWDHWHKGRRGHAVFEIALGLAEVPHEPVLLYFTRLGNAYEVRLNGNLLDSRAQLASDELNVVTAQNQRDIARLQLIQLLNLDAAGAANFQIDLPQLPDPDDEAAYNAEPAAIFETAQGLMPEIKAADLRVRSSQLGIDVARGAYLPRLTFGAGVFTGFSSSRLARVFNGDSTAVVPIPVVQYVGGQPQPTTFAVLQPKQAIPELLPAKFSDQVKDNLGRQLQFNLNIPILNGFQARTNVQRAQVTARQAELRAEQTRLTLRQNIQQAAADALAAQRRFTSSKRQVEALTTAYRNAEIRFNNGLLNGTEFNIAKNNLAAAESTMIQAKYEFIFRSKVLDFYQGRPLAL